MWQDYQLQHDHARQQEARRASGPRPQYSTTVPQPSVFNSAPQLPTYTQTHHAPHQQWPQANSYQEQYYTAQTSPQTVTHPQSYVSNPVNAEYYQQEWQSGGSFQSASQTPGYHPNTLSNAAFAQPQSNYLQHQHNTQASALLYKDSGVTKFPYTSGQPSLTIADQRSLLTPTVVGARQPAQTQKAVVMPKPIKLTAFGSDDTHAKRRKSNEGVAIKEQRTSTGAISKVKKPEQKLQTDKIASGDVDSDVLIALGEEYTIAAHNMAPALQTSDQSQLKEYQRLISTAVDCYNSALSFRHTARQEARLRLKLATLIFEETTSHDTAIEILSKGISACEQNRLLDLKYTLQYQSLRILYSKNVSQAQKANDKTITEVHTLQLHHWTIAFRLLKFAHASQQSAGDIVAALRNLAAVQELAQNGNAILLSTMVSCIEALLHLRGSTVAALASAQSSLASAMQYQLQPELQEHPQLRTLVSVLTMACQIIEFRADPMQAALKPMSEEQDVCARAKNWRDDGAFIVKLTHKPSDHFFGDTAGLFTRMDDGHPGLVIDWLSKGAMLTMCYMLSGVALMPRNGENRRSETFLKEAMKIHDAQDVKLAGSLHRQEAYRLQCAEINIALRMTTAAIYASRSEYKMSLEILQSLSQDSHQGKYKMDKLDMVKLKHLTACCLQGRGELDKAMRLYGEWLKRDFEDDYLVDVRKDIHCLSILNSIHIMRTLPPSNILDPQQALASIKNYCLTHPNKSFASAYHIIDATLTADPGITTLKKSLNQALTPAQSVKNKQMLTLIMNRMSEIFFTDIIGAQAIKSANAARTLARQAGDNLWTAVGCGMLRDTLQKSGQLEEAAAANRNARDSVVALPTKVKATLQLG